MTCIIDEARYPCNSLSTRPGIVNFAQVLVDRHPSTSSYGIFNCRTVRNASFPSKHGNSEAFDWAGSIPVINLGVAALILVADTLGVQRIIHAGRIWDCDRGWHTYTGSAGPHLDHAHIELNIYAAIHLTYAKVVQAFGIPQHRRPRDVPKITDVVASLRVPSGRLDLTYDGHVQPHGDAKFYGDFPHLPPESKRGQVGRFLSIIGTKGSDPYAYSLISIHGQSYDFTKGTAANL